MQKTSIKTSDECIAIKDTNLFGIRWFMRIEKTSINYCTTQSYKDDLLREVSSIQPLNNKSSRNTLHIRKE